MLEAAGELIGFTSFFNNVVTIVVLLIAWLIVLLAFFVLSVQLFITIIEFKLTTLAGFVLIPFALFGKTAFLAERVLGSVITSGIKLMVLAIVLGIGSSIFSEIATPPSGDVDLTHAASVILAAIAVFGLALFVPGIAAGLISGAPQLGAGAAAGTAAGLVGTGVIGGMAASGTLRGAGHLAGGGVKAAANVAGRTSAGFESGGTAGAMKAAVGAPLKNTAAAAAAPVTDSYRQGQASGFRANQSSSPSPAGGRGADVAGSSSGGTGAPGWARKMHRRQRLREAGQTAAHSLREGDRGAHGDGPKLDPDK